MRKICSASASAAGLAVAALLLSGCNSGGSVAEQTVVTKTETVAAHAASKSAAAQETPATAATDADSGDSADDSSGTHVLKFGDTYKFQGWSITISTPKPYTPSQYAFTDHKHPTYRLMTVTVKNSSSNKAVKPDLIDISAQVGDAEGDEVFDGNNVGSPPNASVLPGRSVSWKIAFGAKVGDQITVQVSDFASFDGPVAAFDGKVS